MVQPILILHDGSGAYGRIGIGEKAKLQSHAAILIIVQILCRITVNGMIALTVMIGIIEVVKLQVSILRYEGHRIPNIGILRRRI